MEDTCSLKPFVEHIVNRWESNGSITDRATAIEHADTLAHLVDEYVFTHLIITLCEIRDMHEQFYGEQPAPEHK